MVLENSFRKTFEVTVAKQWSLSRPVPRCMWTLHSTRTCNTEEMSLDVLAMQRKYCRTNWHLGFKSLFFLCHILLLFQDHWPQPQCLGLTLALKPAWLFTWLQWDSWLWAHFSCPAGLWRGAAFQLNARVWSFAGALRIYFVVIHGQTRCTLKGLKASLSYMGKHLHSQGERLASFMQWVNGGEEDYPEVHNELYQQN